MIDERRDEDNLAGPAGLASDLILQGAEVVAMEQDAMRKFAILRKRDPKGCLESCLTELNSFPEEAEKAFYRMPRRSKGCKHASNVSCQNCNWIEGPSVGTARVVARSWGNCTVGVRVASETNEHWDLEGRFLDFETNFSATRGLRVLKRVKWAGQLKHVSELDPMVEFQIFQAGVSKAFRNVVRDGVPEAIINRYWTTARQLLAGKAPTKKLSKKAVAKVLDAFSPLRVSPEMLEEKLGKTMDKWSGDDAAALKGILNAIEGKEITLAQVFGGEIPEPEPEPEAEPVQETAEPTAEEQQGLYE